MKELLLLHNALINFYFANIESEFPNSSETLFLMQNFQNELIISDIFWAGEQKQPKGNEMYVCKRKH